jgi:hypothetical protein
MARKRLKFKLALNSDLTLRLNVPPIVSRKGAKIFKGATHLAKPLF